MMAPSVVLRSLVVVSTILMSCHAYRQPGMHVHRSSLGAIEPHIHHPCGFLSGDGFGHQEPPQPLHVSIPSKVSSLIASRMTKNVIISLCSYLISTPCNVNAIGSINELSKQSMVLQDVSFNVPNNQGDVASLQALFQDKLKQLRQVNTKDDRVLSVIGFGADAYDSPPSFLPGISDFQEDGAHCTITLRDKVKSGSSDDEVELFERGNGLEFLKVGVETLRLSKGIENGAEIKYAYGWVDLDTPNGIPFNVVVGIARDPLMLAGIRVSSVEKSVDFFTNQLGMEVTPFPLARPVGSNFELPPPPGSVYVSYRGAGETAARAGMGILLIPAKGSVNVGTQLEAFTIVVDDKDTGLPNFVQTLLNNRAASNVIVETRSPDGYRFVLKPYSTFASEATSYVPS